MSKKSQLMKEDKIAEIKEILSNFDPNKTGVYSCSDVGTILRLLNYNPDTEEIQGFIKKMDPGKKGTFGLEVLLKTLKDFKFSDIPSEEIEKMMELLDPGKTGIIDGNLLKEILTEYDEKLTDKEFNIIKKAVDPNDTGKINIKQFIKIIKGG